MGRRRRKHDVFVIGDELSESETTILEDPAAPAGDQAPGGHPQPSGLGRAPTSGAGRALAVLAIAGPLAALTVLISSLGTSGGSKDRSTSPSRSALVQRPAPRVATPPAPAPSPLPELRRAKSRRGDSPPRQGNPETSQHELERESTELQAPESSAPVSELPVAASVPPPVSPPPSPSPPSPGGGHGGTETFGFER